MSYAVMAKHVPATPILTVRRRAHQSDLPRLVPELCGLVWKYAKATGAPSPGRHVVVYRNWKDGEMDVEIGVEVGAGAAGAGEIALGALPTGTAATVTHLGSYAVLGNANTAIREWCKANGRELTGTSWEIYGHMGPDPPGARTDVFYLLKS
ncbi:MAG TPA: GyrI-like domain-containing protein [Gemmatimonadaceae bacterium]|jgi:effector-binding domain-containing protein|nr:GyrI-like domain-containing protein [Gemmatimonadaceae bacterium]